MRRTDTRISSGLLRRSIPTLATRSLVTVLLVALLGVSGALAGESPTAMDHGELDPTGMDHTAMDHAAIDHGTMDHGETSETGAPNCHGPATTPTTTDTVTTDTVTTEDLAVAIGELAIPDLALVDQDGESRRFVSEVLAGRKVAINFVFTTCTTVCPPMGATFGRLQDLLGERLGPEVTMVSVSIDPVVDTPERLTEWSARFGRREGWTLLTGPKPEVDRLLKALQVFTPDAIDHSPTVLLGNPATGRWERAYGLASPQQMVTLLDGLAGADSTRPTAEVGR